MPRGYFYRKYGLIMVKKYRQKSIEKFGEEFFSQDNYFGSPLKPKHFRTSSSFPTFWEFVQYLIYISKTSNNFTNVFEDHWRQQSRDLLHKEIMT